jgi:hypothetical protein
LGIIESGTRHPVTIYKRAWGEINGTLLEPEFWPALRDAHDKQEFRVLEIREELKTLCNEGDRASDATTWELPFSAQSSKILRAPAIAGCTMKIPSSPKELAGSYEVRQVLGHSDEGLVFRSGETVVRWGNDVNAAIDGWPVAGLLIIPESHILNAPGAWRKTRGPGQLHSARAHPNKETMIV